MKSLKIEKVSYSQLFSFGNFQNEKIGITAIVEEGEIPSLVMDKIRRMVIETHEKHEKIREFINEIRQLASIRDNLKYRIKLHNGLDGLSTEANEKKMKDIDKEIKNLENKLKLL